MHKARCLLSSSHSVLAIAADSFDAEKKRAKQAQHVDTDLAHQLTWYIGQHAHDC